MSDKIYDGDDIQRLGGVIAEQIIHEFKTGFEAIEEIKRQVGKIPQIQEDVGNPKRSMRVITTAVKDTNKDLRSLDKAAGNTEHRVDMNLKFAKMSFGELHEQTRLLKSVTDNHEQRLASLEANA